MGRYSKGGEQPTAENLKTVQRYVDCAMTHFSDQNHFCKCSLDDLTKRYLPEHADEDAELFKLGLFSNIKKKSDFDFTAPIDELSEKIDLPTLHNLWNYNQFLTSQKLWDEFADSVPLLHLEFPDPSDSLRTLCQTHIGHSIYWIYLNKAIRKLWDDLFDNGVSEVKPLSTYLAELETQRSITPYFGPARELNFTPLSFARALLHERLLKYINFRLTKIAPEDVTRKRYKLFYQKLFQCLRHENFATRSEIAFPGTDTPQKPKKARLDAIHYLQPLYDNLRNIGPRNRIHFPKSQLRIDVLHAVPKGAQTQGTAKAYQQDLAVHWKLNEAENFADRTNPYTQLTTVITDDEDRQNILWNLMFQLQERYGNKEVANCNKTDPSNPFYTGSTANIALTVVKPNEIKIYLASIGDTDTLLVRRKANGDFTTQSLNLLHSAKKRLNSTLSMSRSIGDCDVEQGGLVHHPDVRCFTIKPLPGEEYVLVKATDGLRDAFTKINSAPFTDTVSGLFKFHWDHFRKFDDLPNKAELMAQALVLYAIKGLTQFSSLDNEERSLKKPRKMDNTTALVLPLVHDGLGQEEIDLLALMDGHGGINDKGKDVTKGDHVVLHLKKNLIPTFRDVLTAGAQAKQGQPARTIPLLGTGNPCYKVADPKPARHSAKPKPAPKPKPPPKATIENQQKSNCLSSPIKMELLEEAWEKIAANSKAAAKFSPLEVTHHHYQKALIGKIDGHALTILNQGSIHLQTTTPLMAEAALQLNLATQLMVNDAILTPQKGKDGLLRFPTGHPRANQTISIIVNSNDPEAKAILLKAAKKLGLQVENAPATKKAMLEPETTLPELDTEEAINAAARI